MIPKATGRRSPQRVQRWSVAGVADLALRPMLDDDDEKIRFSAAAYLLGLGFAAQAVPVLTELEQQSPSLVGSSAKLLLMRRRHDAVDP